LCFLASSPIYILVQQLSAEHLVPMCRWGQGVNPTSSVMWEIWLRFLRVWRVWRRTGRQEEAKPEGVEGVGKAMPERKSEPRSSRMGVQDEILQIKKWNAESIGQKDWVRNVAAIRLRPFVWSHQSQYCQRIDSPLFGALSLIRDVRQKLSNFSCPLKVVVP